VGDLELEILSTLCCVALVPNAYGLPGCWARNEPGVSLQGDPRLSMGGVGNLIDTANFHDVLIWRVRQFFSISASTLFRLFPIFPGYHRYLAYSQPVVLTARESAFVRRCKARNDGAKTTQPLAIWLARAAEAER
jgi:hypothetical protein